MPQRSHDPFSPHDAVDVKPKPAKTTRRARPTPADTSAENAKSMVVDPTAVKTAPKKKTTTPAKKQTPRRRANKTSSRKGRR